LNFCFQPTQAARLAWQECAQLGRSADGCCISEADVEATGPLDGCGSSSDFASVQARDDRRHTIGLIRPISERIMWTRDFGWTGWRRA
jgi:hypothetical protein